MLIVDGPCSHTLNLGLVVILHTKTRSALWTEPAGRKLTGSPERRQIALVPDERAWGKGGPALIWRARLFAAGGTVTICYVQGGLAGCVGDVVAGAAPCDEVGWHCKGLWVLYCAVLAAGDKLGIIYILNRQNEIHGLKDAAFVKLITVVDVMRGCPRVVCTPTSSYLSHSIMSCLSTIGRTEFNAVLFKQATHIQSASALMLFPSDRFDP